MSNMPPGFGSRSIDHDHFHYDDPAFGCPDCGASFADEGALDGRACTECGSEVDAL